MITSFAYLTLAGLTALTRRAGLITRLPFQPGCFNTLRDNPGVKQTSPGELPRTDKWELGNGGTLYAPEHPLHLHVPGFWDEVRIGGHTFAKLLCVSFVLEQDGALIELDPYLSYWYWYPDHIEARYYLVRREGIGYKQQAGVRVFMDERRYIADDGSLHCEISFDLLKQHPTHLHVVAWGVDSELSSPDGLPPASAERESISSAPLPKLALTPHLESLQSGALSLPADSAPHNLAALHWYVALDADNPVVLHVQAGPRTGE